jgi:selenide,water dikinase
LSDALRGFPAPTDPNLLVGFESSDDAAVYRLSEDLAVISTVDFITPPVDDPVWFGRIAAANSLSDIYAMGGRPVTALNLVMFPSKKLSTDVLREILRGGNEKVVEAGASLAGGHSVDDEEPKYGLAVTGVVSPRRILTNRGVLPGDGLVLTKPLGTGVLFNACRSKKLPWPELEAVLPQVAALNRTALDVALGFDVHACTDITGFALLGHALEMARGSGVRIDLSFGALPFYPNVLDMYARGETTGSNRANRQLVQESLEMKAKLSPKQEEVLFDPQTSGGLLLAVPAEQAEPLAEKLREAGVMAAHRIGEASESPQPLVRVV